MATIVSIEVNMVFGLLMMSDDLNVWMLEQSLREKWKTPFRLYSRIKVKSLFSVKCFALFLPVISVLAVISVPLSLIVFPSMFGVDGFKGSFLFDALIFIGSFAFNLVAINQAKGADDLLYGEYCRNQIILVVLLIIFGICVMLFGYSSLLSSMFVSLSLGFGVFNTLCETDFKKAAIDKRKTQIDRFQDLREFNRYLRKEIALIGKLPEPERKLYESKQKAYEKLLAKSKVEYAYLENALK